MRVAAEAIWTGSGAQPPGTPAADGADILEAGTLNPGTLNPGTIVIDDGVITAIEPQFDADADHAFRGCVITPGLVNAHVHLDLTYPAESERLDRPFTEWLLTMRDLREREGRDGMERAAQRGIEQSIESGTTTLVDYDATGASLKPLAESPIRRVVLREVIQFAPEFDRCRAVLEEFLAASPTSLELRGLAPHAPYTVQREVLTGCLDLLRDTHRPWSMHICEQPWELELMLAGRGPGADWLGSIGVDPKRFGVPGMSTVEYLADVGALADPKLTPGLLVHANYLDRDELASLTTTGATIVYCPRSHHFFAHTPHPLPDLIAHGVPVCLGTDGTVSTGTGGHLSMLEEMRAAKRAHSDLRPDTLFRMTTALPHKALGQTFGTGKLEPNQPADLAVWNNAKTLAEVIERGECQATFIAGHRVHSAPGS